MCRCPWLDTSKADYVAYHDDEWGVPIFADHKLFEFLTLEAAQAGLSWYTVLKKRDNYRQAFANFDPTIVATFNEEKIQELLQNPGIIRNQLKVRAAVNNAARFLEVQQEFGSFSNYQWQFVDNKPIVNAPETLQDYAAKSAISDAFSKDLKRRGFKFVGSTIIYAHMQACGMINDHSQTCFRREPVMALYPTIPQLKTAEG